MGRGGEEVKEKAAGRGSRRSQLRGVTDEERPAPGVGIVERAVGDHSSVERVWLELELGGVVSGICFGGDDGDVGLESCEEVLEAAVPVGEEEHDAHDLDQPVKGGGMGG